MSYREFVPDPRLGRLVDRLWLRTPDEPTASAGAPGRGHLILPDGCIDVIVRVELRASRVGSAAVKLVGAMSRAAEVPSDDTGLLAAVRFRPGGAAPLLGVPAASLTDQALGAEQLACLRALPSALAQSCERAAHPRPGDHAPGAAAPRQVLAALERWLLGRAAASPGPDPLVAHAVARLFGAAPPHTDALAREVGFSRQHLRRRLLDQVGLAPKELARVARLQRAVARLQRQRAGGLAAAALELGFFDQAHMARELRLLAGLTARAVTASAGSIFPIHSLLAEADCGHEEAHPQPDRGRHRDLPGVLGRPARLRQDRGGAGG